MAEKHEQKIFSEVFSTRYDRRLFTLKKRRLYLVLKMGSSGISTILILIFLESYLYINLILRQIQNQIISISLMT